MRRLGLLLIFLTACDGGSTASPDAGPTPDGPPGADRPVVGGVSIVESRGTSGGQTFTSGQLTAVFYDGHGPRWHREAMRAGACVLRTFTPSSCPTACTDGLCISGVCESFPAVVSAGRLTMSGLAVTVSITPSSNFYESPPLPPELFGDTAMVSAQLAGGVMPAMSLSTRGVPPLATAIASGKITVPNPAGQAFPVRWTPTSDPDARIRLTLNSNNQGHGQPFLAIIECDAPDSAGQIDVPAALLDGFPETMAWEVCAGTDCPFSTIRRYHRATHPIGDQDVELVIASEQLFGIEHPAP